jgi:hypothetical protein
MAYPDFKGLSETSCKSSGIVDGGMLLDLKGLFGSLRGVDGPALDSRDNSNERRLADS